MSAKNSKFSGIFAQTREREAVNPAEIETPNDTKSEDESAQNSPQDTSKADKVASKKPVAMPKKSDVSHSKAEVAATETAPNVAHQETDTTSMVSSKGRPRGKRSDPNFTQITAYISKNTHQNVKIALLNEEQKREISELIEDQLVAWLAQRSP